MPHMPELQNVSGKARFEGGSLHFDIAGRHRGRPRGDRRHHRADRPRRPDARYADAAHSDHGTGADGRWRCSRGPSSACRATRSTIPSGWAATSRSISRSRFPLLNALAVADIDIKAEAALSGFSLKNAIGDVDLTDAVGRAGLRQLAAQRHRRRQARWQRRRHRLARAVRPARALSPALRAEGHDPGGADRQGGLSVARALCLRRRSASPASSYQVARQRHERAATASFDLKGAKAARRRWAGRRTPAPKASSRLG